MSGGSGGFGMPSGKTSYIHTHLQSNLGTFGEVTLKNGVPRGSTRKSTGRQVIYGSTRILDTLRILRVYLH